MRFVSFFQKTSIHYKKPIKVYTFLGGGGLERTYKYNASALALSRQGISGIIVLIHSLSL